MSADTPRARDWDAFWVARGAAQATRLSWSKRRIIKLLEPYATRGRRALDVGCGSGFFSQFFCARGMETVAIDYADSALAMTRDLTHGRARVMKADVTAQNFRGLVDERFDLIFSDGLLEHFSRDNQHAIIRNLLSVLSDVGVVVTVVPNRLSPWQLIRPFMMRGISETPLFSSTLVSLQKKNNLTIIESGGLNVIPFAASPDKLLGRFFGMLLYTVARR